MRERVKLAAAFAGLALLAGCAQPSAEPESPVSGLTVQDDDGMNGAVLAQPYDVPAGELVATDGSTYSLARDAEAPLTLVFFGYTHCPDICQVVMADIASALVRLEDSERAQVDMVFVTTDPARDDEATLREYLDRFDPGFEGLTGSLRRVVEVGDALGVAIEKGQRLPSGGYEVAHGTQVVGVTPDGTAPIVWTQGTPPEQLAEDIRVLLADGVPTGGAQ